MLANKAKKGYQRCVKSIVTEPNQWRNKGGNDWQVSIYFNPPVFRYCPRFSELRAVLIRLIALYGIDYVSESLGMEIRIKNESKGTD